MISKIMTGSKHIIGRLDHGSNLLESLTEICVKHNIRAGAVQAIGALYNASIGFYDQKSHSYMWIHFPEHIELVSLMGNVSIKDGTQMVHAHVAIANELGKTFGGHLAPGAKVFACEYIITPFDGELVRQPDDTTGLSLWAE